MKSLGKQIDRIDMLSSQPLMRYSDSRSMKDAAHMPNLVAQSGFLRTISIFILVGLAKRFSDGLDALLSAVSLSLPVPLNSF